MSGMQVQHLAQADEIWLYNLNRILVIKTIKSLDRLREISD